MNFLQKRWVAVTLCVLMILASFAISKEKQSAEQMYPAIYLDSSGVPLYDAFGNPIVGFDFVPHANLVETGVRFGMASIGVLVFVALITLLILAAVIMALVRAGRRKTVMRRSVAYKRTSSRHFDHVESSDEAQSGRK